MRFGLDADILVHVADSASPSRQAAAQQIVAHAA
jgi:hypothetical protein